MRQKLLRTIACLGIAVGIAALVWYFMPTGEDDQLAGADDQRDPVVQTLLDESTKNDPDHNRKFIAAFSDLLQKHGSGVTQCLRHPHEAEEGWAVRVDAGRDSRVLAILGGCDCWMPGEDTQYLFLLDHHGRIKDQLSCSVSNRLTRFFVGSGSLRTAVLDAPARDGAQLVVYLTDRSGPSLEGDQDGLCRLAFRGGKFSVLFVNGADVQH
jgi:hypothetical protein